MNLCADTSRGKVGKIHCGKVNDMIYFRLEHDRPHHTGVQMVISEWKTKVAIWNVEHNQTCMQS